MADPVQEDRRIDSGGKTVYRRSWSRYGYGLAFVAIVLLSAVNAFWRLDTAPVRDWDEARRGVAAHEMLESGNHLVHTYRGAVDYWSLKPPLGYWLIAAAFRTLGRSVFALRFPAAIAGVLSVVCLMILLRLRRAPIASLVGGLVLATSYPFFLQHSVRSGEFDAGVVLLICLAALALHLPLNSMLRFGLAGLCVAATFLLKGMAVAYIAAILGLWLWTDAPRLGVRPGTLWALLTAALLPVLIYGALRWQVDGSVFFKKMLYTDVMTRPFHAIEGHTSPFGFWFKQQVYNYHCRWMVFVAAAALLVWRLPNRDALLQAAPFLAWVVVPIAGVALMRTRLPWYFNPVYPAIAALTGLTAEAFVRRYRTRPALLALCCTAVLALGASAQFDLRKAIREPARDPAQEALLALPASERGSGTITATEWPQSRVFVCEVLLGLACREGTAAAFLAKPDEGLLFLPADTANMPDLEPVCGNEAFVVLRGPSGGHP